MIVKDTLKSYTDTPYSRLLFQDSDLDSSVLVNLKHFQSKASSTTGQAALKFFPNRLDRQEGSIEFELASKAKVDGAYDASRTTNKVSLSIFPDDDPTATAVATDFHIENVVLAKAYDASDSYVWVLTGAFELEKVLVEGTIDEIYQGFGGTGTDFLTFDILDAPDGTTILDSAATINTTAHTITANVNAGIVLGSGVTPVFTLDYGATVTLITTNVEYTGFEDGVGESVTVTADDGNTTQAWTITLTVLT